MTASNGSRRNGKGGASQKAIVDSFREICPSHKVHHLDALVKELKGDEDKIRERISTWWDEPAPRVEEEWEDVNKKHGKKKETTFYRGRGGRGGGRGEGRGRGRGESRGRGGSRAESGGRGGARGRGPGRGRSQPREKTLNNAANAEDKNNKNDHHNNNDIPIHSAGPAGERTKEELDVHPPPPGGIPANVSVPHGRWSKKQQESEDGAPLTAPEEEKDEDKPEEAPVPAVEAHAPIGPPNVNATPGPKHVARPGPRGNVWATRGSAHLIQAEKPKPPAPAPVAPIKRSAPPPLPPPPQPSLPETSQLPEKEPELEHDVDPVVTLAQQEQLEEHAVPNVDDPPMVEEEPAAVATELEPDNVWGSPPPTSPPMTTQQEEDEAPAVPAVSSSPIHKQPIGAPIVEPPAATVKMPDPAQRPQPPTPQVPPAVERKPEQPRAPPSVLNMGHWDAEDGDDKNIDFGFGSPFGDNTEAASIDATTASSSTHNVSQGPHSKDNQTATNPSAPSPARPPPGLSIGGGMRPIPADAVLVHELENKLEEASLNAAQPVSDPSPAGLPTQQNPTVAPEPTVPPSAVANAEAPSAPTHPNHTYNQTPTSVGATGSMAVYNYGATPAAPGFIGGMPGNAPGLGNPIPHKPPMGGPLGPSQPPQLHPQQSLYGAAHSTQQQQHPPNAPSSNNAPTHPPGGSAPSNTDNSNSNTNGNNPTPTPGLPPGMPGMPYNPALFYSQQPYLGQHQGQLGYNYGYTAQFGGAVQGAFGYPPSMGGGYGSGPHYDDQGGSHQGSGGYQKNSGGYRGQRNHHNNPNQYQNQYNPQQHAGAYGGQPYGAMGYPGDFARSGYGQPGSIQEHYMQQQQQQQQAQAQIGVFQNDDQYKSKKGGAGRGGYHQFQMGPPPHLNQQPFGLQGAAQSTAGGGVGSDSTGAANSNSANNSTPGGGGWSNQTSGGGWGGGAPSWQGK